MPDPAQIIGIRNRSKKRKTHFPIHGTVMLVSGLVSILFFTFTVVASLLYIEFTQNLPNIDELPILLDPPNGQLLKPTQVFDRTGKHLLYTLEDQGTLERQFLPLDPLLTFSDTDTDQSSHLSNELVLITIAITEPDYWEYSGFANISFFNNSPPKIAQNLIADLLLWNESPGLKKGFRERLLATQAIKKFGREKILTWYLNNTKYGHLIYGADAAARAFFGKSAAEIDLAESAILVASATTPSINPLTAPEQVCEKANLLLLGLLEKKIISQQQYIVAMASLINFESQVRPTSNPPSAVINLILQQTNELMSQERIERGGIRIISTLDYDLQEQAYCAIVAQLRRAKGNYEEVKTQDGKACESARLLPTLSLQDNLPGQVDASAVMIDPQKGEVLSIVEASYKNNPSQNNSTNIDENLSLDPHPAGTILTPFIYLTGFTRGLSPASLLWDIPQHNNDISYRKSTSIYHGPVRLRIALANDYIEPVRQILNQVGTANVLNLTNQMGMNFLHNEAFSSIEEPEIENFLDSNQISLQKITQAYGVFANQGILTGITLENTEVNSLSINLQPRIVLTIEDRYGNAIPQYSVEDSEQRTINIPVISSQIAYLMTNILSDETARWPSLGHPNALEIGRPAAAKFGKTSTSQSMWTIGYTPYLVTGIWIGHSVEENADSIPSSVITGIWHSLMQYAGRHYPPQDWLVPSGIVKINVCDPSGLLPGDDCPDIVSDVFLEENVPTQTDTLYRRLQINRETGRLATIFTPPEFIENRVYIMVPPEALDWAKQVGMPIPPETYDVITDQNPKIASDILIASPQMYTYVNKIVSIEGTISSQDIETYQLRIGKGLYPQEWLEIPNIGILPAINTKLAMWDTTGLSGLYTIQLLAIRKDQQVVTRSVQVTVDNSPPQINILYPRDESSINTQKNSTVTFQFDSIDDIGVRKIDLFIDNNFYTTLIQSPYVVTWSVKPGEHTLEVIAYDLAGNTAEARTDFTVAFSE